MYARKDPEEALAQLERDRPDLVVLDVRLPDEDGFGLCRQMREQLTDRDVPILFLSAACTLEERVQGLRAGGDDFIRKPFDVVELTAQVQAHLARVEVLRSAAARAAQSKSPPKPPSGTSRRKAKG